MTLNDLKEQYRNRFDKYPPKGSRADDIKRAIRHDDQPLVGPPAKKKQGVRA